MTRLLGGIVRSAFIAGWNSALCVHCSTQAMSSCLLCLIQLQRPDALKKSSFSILQLARISTRGGRKGSSRKIWCCVLQWNVAKYFVVSKNGQGLLPESNSCNGQACMFITILKVATFEIWRCTQVWPHVAVSWWFMLIRPKALQKMLTIHRSLSCLMEQGSLLTVHAGLDKYLYTKCYYYTH